MLSATILIWGEEMFFIGDKYGFLSCLAFSPMVINHIHFPNAMAAFQSFKTTDLAYRKFRFENCEPFDAYKAGHRLPLRPDWKDLREDVMLQILKRKFRIPAFREKLVALDEPIVADTKDKNDEFWGVYYKSGGGRNTLGRLLMRVRAECRAEIL